jgi:hypothetical protein
VVQSPPLAPVAETLGEWGLNLDLGISGILPDFGLLATWRPYSWVHAQVGAGFNLISPGIRGGLTTINPLVIPFSLTGEVGHYFDGNANRLVNSLTGQGNDIAILRQVGYDYVNVLVGLTSGGKHFVYYFRTGMTYVRATVHDFQETASSLAKTPVEASDVHVTYHGPTLKFGVIAFY